MKWIHKYMYIYILYLEPQMTLIFEGQPNPQKQHLNSNQNNGAPFGF